MNVHCGATGTQSQYPLAAIYNENAGLALGIDLNFAAQYRIVYHPGAKLFYIAYDFGLVKDTERFPSSVDFRFVMYRFGPSWGFRGAFEQYMVTFPKFFDVRSREQGIWMPFTDVSTVRGWEDFGFKYHEGNNNVPWDDAQRHSELPLHRTDDVVDGDEEEMPRTAEQAVRVRDELAQGQQHGAAGAGFRECGHVRRGRTTPADLRNPVVQRRGVEPQSEPVPARRNQRRHRPLEQAVKERFYGPAPKADWMANTSIRWKVT